MKYRFVKLRVLHIQIKATNIATKVYVEQTTLNFWTKVSQKGYFRCNGGLVLQRIKTPEF